MMSNSKVMLRFLAAVFLFASAVISDDSWDRHLVLDREGIFHVHWTPKENRIVFKVEVAAKGYVGFGLSPHGGMTGSDIVTGWIVDGKAYFQDRHGVRNAFPPKDRSQDWVLSRGWENDTHTSLIFYRNLITCDPDDMEIDGSTIRLIYAYTDTDPIDEDALEYHGSRRGSRSTFLLQGKMNHLKNLDGLPYWDVKAPNFTLSSSDKEKYWSSIHKSPHLNVKHHAIQIEPLIQSNNELYVHHMLIFECIGPVPEELERYVDRQYQYPDSALPESLNRCEMLLVVWDAGGKGVVFPSQAGLPLPGEIPKYYRLEIHYDNPFLQDNIRDESGFRIYYTPELRKYDAGILGIAARPAVTLFIPPHLDEFTVATHSSQECMAKKIPPSGIKMFGMQLHAHKLARRIRVRHFRGNKELPPLADERYYDYNYQNYKYLGKEVNFLPSDQITVECSYNSSRKSETTFGGAFTSDEMCVTFILYYPSMGKSSFSGPPLALIAHLLGAPEQLTTNSSGISQKSPESNLKEYIKTIDWASQNISNIGKIIRFAPQEVLCFPGNKQDKYEKMKNLVGYPESLIPYHPKTSKCFRKLN